MIILKENMHLLKYFTFPVSANPSKYIISFIYKNIKTPSDILHWGAFFSKLYDEIYHELALKKILVEKKVLRLIEFLASVSEKHEVKQLEKYCNQIKKVRREIYKEEMKKRIKRDNGKMR